MVREIKQNHKQQTQSVRCFIITVSDTRTLDSDKSGRVIEKLLGEARYVVGGRIVIPDEAAAIRKHIHDACSNRDIDVILTNGGTGISARDVTIETIQELLDKEMTGFGELFRMLSYEEDIGSAAMMSRALAGIHRNTAIFASPGSSGAVKLAMNKLIIPELEHVVHELNKDLP